jgi:hypothetical protein
MKLMKREKSLHLEPGKSIWGVREEVKDSTAKKATHPFYPTSIIPPCEMSCISMNIHGLG